MQPPPRNDAGQTCQQIKSNLKAVKCKTFPSSEHQSVILPLTFRGRALTQRDGRRGNCGQDMRMETQPERECVGTRACCVRAKLVFCRPGEFWHVWTVKTFSLFPVSLGLCFEKLRGFCGIKWDEWSHQSKSTHMRIWEAYLVEIHRSASMRQRKSYLEK